jgi:hypothetical protein
MVKVTVVVQLLAQALMLLVCFLILSAECFARHGAPLSDLNNRVKKKVCVLGKTNSCFFD